MKFFIVLALAFALIAPVAPATAQLVINEVLYDPSDNMLDGDANGDGTYTQVGDEFIEFVNTSATALDVSSYKIFDLVIATNLKTLRHRVGANTVVPAGSAFVVFGGGTAVGTFGGARVEVDRGTQGLSLANSGEIIIVEDSAGNLVDSMNTDARSNNPNESYTQSPDRTGPFVQHATARAGVRYSPGFRVDGTPFPPAVAAKKRLTANRFEFFPNPGSGTFYLRAGTPFGGTIIVMDALGKVVKNQVLLERQFNLAALSVGIYSISYTQADAQSTARLVISK